MPFYNGVELIDSAVKLTETPGKHMIGATTNLLQQMAWLQREEQKEVEPGFSYNYLGMNVQGATIGPIYQPQNAYKTDIGKYMRAADDRLKLSLLQLNGIKNVKDVVDSLFSRSGVSVDAQGCHITLQLPGCISRIRLREKCVIGFKDETKLFIKDVHLTLEYDRRMLNDKDVIANSECELKYLRYLEREWIPKMAKKNTEFRQLKEVIVAKTIMNYLYEYRRALPLPSWEPKAKYDKPEFMNRILFENTSCRKDIWVHLGEEQSYSAALIVFHSPKPNKRKNITIYVHRDVKTGYQTKIMKQFQPDKQLHSMTLLCTLNNVQPVCPEGGIILNALAKFQAPREMYNLVTSLHTEASTFIASVFAKHAKATEKKTEQHLESKLIVAQTTPDVVSRSFAVTQSKLPLGSSSATPSTLTTNLVCPAITTEVKMSAIPRSRNEILNIIECAAIQYDIPRNDFLRFAYIETGGTFNEKASRGEHGAKGVFQFVPTTAEEYNIRGKELDAIANTDAAARLYLKNARNLPRSHPYLSNKSQPDGLDMYMAHQQGTAGYGSIQTAIATGRFSREDTRKNVLNNLKAEDLQDVVGVSKAQIEQMNDRDIAKTWVNYFKIKYDRVSIPEKGI